MTGYELWVMERMWARGFSAGIISDSLGYSWSWVNELIQKNRDRFPPR